MPRAHKGKSAPGKRPRSKSEGEHGGNRDGRAKQAARRPKKSSQAAGKDPHRDKA
jgi:hypothetical protein